MAACCSEDHPRNVPRIENMKQRFWNVDLKDLFRVWLDQMWTFLLTLLTFVAMSLPVVIPALIIWYMAGLPRLF